MNGRAEKYVSNILKYPTKKEARLEAGYSPSYSTSGHIEKTKAVRKAMEDVTTKLEAERDRLIDAMSEDDLTEVQYRDKATSLDKIQKQIQLLTGGETERTRVVVIPSEIADKNNLNAEDERTI